LSLSLKRLEVDLPIRPRIAARIFILPLCFHLLVSGRCLVIAAANLFLNQALCLFDLVLVCILRLSLCLLLFVLFNTFNILPN